MPDPPDELCSFEIKTNRTVVTAKYDGYANGKTNSDEVVVRKLFLVKLALEQRLDLSHSGVGVLAIGMDGEFAARAGGQHHQAHDAFAVHLLAILLDEDIAGEPVCSLDEHGGGPGVDAQLVHDGEFLGQGSVCIRKSLCAHQIGSLY